MSMSIGSATSVAATQGAAGTNPVKARMDSVMQSVASLLGTTPADLQSQLRSGQSLASIAQNKGVTSAALMTAIKNGIESADAATGSSTPQSQLDNIANQIANRVPQGPGHHHHGGHHGAGSIASTSSSSSSSTLADLLSPTSTSSTDPTASAATLSAPSLFDQAL